jgi:hypothetical protein
MVVSNGALCSIFLSFIEFMILIMFLLLPGCSSIRVLLSWKLETQLILFVCILIRIISVPSPNPNPQILTLTLSAQKCGLSIGILFVFDLCFLLGYMICLGQHTETILNMYPQHSNSCNVPSGMLLFITWCGSEFQASLHLRDFCVHFHFQ